MLLEEKGDFTEEIDAFEPVEEEVVVDSGIAGLRQDALHVGEECVDLLGDEVFS
jgi:hypothetical protein